jgi:hypothetical protein
VRANPSIAARHLAGAIIPLGVLVASLTAGCRSEDTRPPVWDYISPAITQPSCATVSCHSRAAAIAGLDFSDPDRGYTSLTQLWVLVVYPSGTNGPGCGVVDGVDVCEQKLRPLVTPYDPAQSKLVQMLRAQDASRMPPDRPLAEADIRLIERWILDGAHRHQNDVDDAGAPDGVTATDGATAGEVGDAHAATDGVSPPADAAPGDGAATRDGSGSGG